MRLINADKTISDYAHYGISHSYDVYDLEDILTECPTIEAIEKADIITMLEEIKDLANDECWDLDREHNIELPKEVVNLDVIENIIQ